MNFQIFLLYSSNNLMKVCTTSHGVVHFFVRARSCFTLWIFSLIRKTELWKINKPPEAGGCDS